MSLWFCVHTMKVSGGQCCLDTNIILQNTRYFKQSHTGLERQEGEKIMKGLSL